MREIKTIEERLYDRRYIKNDCWFWTGALNNVGYGMIRVQDKMKLVHRVSYELFNNQSIPHKQYVCHTCYNYACFNPDHLYLATKKENSEQMLKDNRHYGRYRGFHHPITSCEHCNKSMGYNMYKRWHGVNCKNKP